MNNKELKEKVKEAEGKSKQQRTRLFNSLALELLEEVAEKYSGFTGDAAREILKLRE